MYADASVFIELHGTDGHVGWQPLEARSSDFSRGGVDEFIIKGSAIGKLDTIGIKHDNKGFGSAWHLQQVEVRNETTGEVGMFPCDKWLDASQGDKKVERQLNRQGEVGSEVTPDSACRYKVRTSPPCRSLRPCCVAKRGVCGRPPEPETCLWCGCIAWDERCAVFGVLCYARAHRRNSPTGVAHGRPSAEGSTKSTRVTTCVWRKPRAVQL
jgi:hypothetical protein